MQTDDFIRDDQNRKASHLVCAAFIEFEDLRDAEDAVRKTDGEAFTRQQISLWNISGALYACSPRLLPAHLP